MHQDSARRVYSGIACQISFAVGDTLRNPDQLRPIPLIGELGRVVKYENRAVHCRCTLTRRLEMARQNVCFAHSMMSEETVRRLSVCPILANERNTLPYVAPDPLYQCANSLPHAYIPQLPPRNFPTTHPFFTLSPPITPP